MRARIAAAGTVLLVVVAWFLGVKVGEHRARLSLAAPEGRAPDGTPLATFAGGRITVEQVRAVLRAAAVPARAGPSTPEARRQLVQDLARTALLAQEARRRGLHQDPAFALAQERSLAMFLTRQLESEASAAAVPEESLRGYYEQHRADFVRPDRVRVALIFVAAEGVGRAEARASKRAAAEELLARIRRDELADPGLFARLARERSEDPATAPAGGDLSFASRGELGERVGSAVAEAAFGLVEIGRTGERLVETPRGFYLLRLLGREPALDLPFEQVRELIRQRLGSERRAEAHARLVAELERRADLRIDEAALRGLRVDPEALQAGEPAALQAGSGPAVPDSEVAK